MVEKRENVTTKGLKLMNLWPKLGLLVWKFTSIVCRSTAMGEREGENIVVAPIPAFVIRNMVALWTGKAVIRFCAVGWKSRKPENTLKIFRKICITCRVSRQEDSWCFRLPRSRRRKKKNMKYENCCNSFAFLSQWVFINSCSREFV